MSWNRRIRELGRFACALVALLLFAEVLETFGVSVPVLSSVDLLLAVATLVVVALLTWWLVRSATLDEAAGATDTRADLKDELKSTEIVA